MRRDSVVGTFLVAFVLCVVCSLLVSSAAVSLRDAQERNKEWDKKKNVLEVAGLYDEDNPPGQSIEELFAKNVTPFLIDLDTGESIGSAEVDPATYDQRDAAKNPKLSEPVEPPEALPGIRRRERFAFVYLVNKDGELDQMVLPIYGKGLWSTLYGFISMDRDTKTIRGITFYEQGETPGLGGEVENPKWKASWKGKQAFDDDWNLDIQVIKGKVNPDSPDADHEVDGLSGATITTRGVSTLVRYWLGPDGFGPYLARQRGETPPTAHREGDHGLPKS